MSVICFLVWAYCAIRTTFSGGLVEMSLWCDRMNLWAIGVAVAMVVDTFALLILDSLGVLP